MLLVQFQFCVVNLSDYPLTEEQEYVLSLGSKFCPTPSSMNQLEFISDIEEVEEGILRLRLKEFF